jgi:NAD(P)-dependent dehydrogenase (short-subunit alcohol dehydrogenase family)
LKEERVVKIAEKVFVVTGGGAGIGREVVLQLLSRGAVVAAVDRRREGLEHTARLADVGDRLSLHAVDVTDRDEVERMVVDVVAAHGSLDGLLNVAGIIQQFVPVMDLDHGEIERVMAVNFWGVVHTVKAVLPHLVTRPEACVINVSSMGALAPVPGQAAYGASKAAVLLLTEALFAELQGTPVAVTVVLPGAVRTHIAENSGVAVPSAGGEGFTATTAPDAARQIVDAVEHGPFRVLIGKDARALDRLARLSPRRATEMGARRMGTLLSH